MSCSASILWLRMCVELWVAARSATGAICLGIRKKEGIYNKITNMQRIAKHIQRYGKTYGSSETKVPKYTTTLKRSATDVPLNIYKAALRTFHKNKQQHHVNTN